MENETQKQIDQWMKDRQEWFTEQLIKFCVELVNEIETLKIRYENNK